jgi:Flp pilus assembly protein TadG
MTRLRAVRARGDDGQLMLLILAYTVIAGLLVTLVVDVSKVYLDRRSLVAAADGAAITAANQPDLDRVYAGAGDVLPLSELGTRSAVRQYARDADLTGRFDGFEVVDVHTDGQTVTVRLRAIVRMPFVNLISAPFSDGYPVEAVANARSPLTP